MTDQKGALALGVLLGAVLLGLVAAFAIVLPRVVDGEEPATSAEQLALPDTLPHGLAAEDLADPGADDQAREFADRVEEVQDSAAEGLEELYDVPAAVRGYASDDGGLQATVTVVGMEPGLFDPHGPPIDPAVLGLERSVYELERVDGAVCDVFWQGVVAQGEPVDESAVPASVQCQLGADGRTYEFLGSGLTAEQAVDALRAAADAG